MKIGSLIKYHRTKQGMTQNTLAMGICSIPHLSKIENNSKEANTETIRLLLERLNINLQDVEKSEIYIKHLLTRLLKHMNYQEEEKAKEALRELKDYEEMIAFTEFIYLYELYKLRFYVFTKEKCLAENQYRWLNAHKQNFSQQERYLFLYFGALVLLLRGKYEEADRELSKVLHENKEFGMFEGEIYYHMAVVKGRLEESSQAIIYGRKALQFYKDQFNFKRILHTLMSLALNYSRGKVYHEAIETYEHLLRNAELLQQHHLLPHIYHNIGDLYQSKGEYDIALNYFERSAKLMPEDTEQFLLCLYNLASTQLRLERREESKLTFLQLKLEAKKKQKLHYRLFSIFYLYLLEDDKVKAMKFLEGRLIPYTAKNEDLKEVHQQFTQLLGEYYRQEGKFEKAVQFII